MNLMTCASSVDIVSSQHLPRVLRLLPVERSRCVASTSISGVEVALRCWKVPGLEALGHRPFVSLMIIQENGDVVTLDTEKVQYVTCPVHLVLHNLLEEMLDRFDRLLR